MTYRRKISPAAKITLAERHGVRETGEPYALACAYCRRPGTVTLWPRHTYPIPLNWDSPNQCWRMTVHPGRYVTTTFEYDHIHPLSRGGTNDASNLTYACAACNISKGSRTLEEWKAWLHTRQGRKSKTWQRLKVAT
jgi:5-methylcytosine-specific restriction endonuclease McrA